MLTNLCPFQNDLVIESITGRGPGFPQSIKTVHILLVLAVAENGLGHPESRDQAPDTVPCAPAECHRPILLIGGGPGRLRAFQRECPQRPSYLMYLMMMCITCHTPFQSPASGEAPIVPSTVTIPEEWPIVPIVAVNRWELHPEETKYWKYVISDILSSRNLSRSSRLTTQN